MNEKFPEYKGLDLSEVNKEILKTWEENKTFGKVTLHSFSMKVLLQRTACPESIM